MCAPYQPVRDNIVTPRYSFLFTYSDADNVLEFRPNDPVFISTPRREEEDQQVPPILVDLASSVSDQGGENGEIGIEEKIKETKLVNQSKGNQNADMRG